MMFIQIAKYILAHVFERTDLKGPFLYDKEYVIVSIGLSE